MIFFNSKKDKKLEQKWQKVTFVLTLRAGSVKNKNIWLSLEKVKICKIPQKLTFLFSIFFEKKKCYFLYTTGNSKTKNIRIQKEKPSDRRIKLWAKIRNQLRNVSALKILTRRTTPSKKHKSSDAKERSKKR